jgi:hypothetical protein
MTFEKGDLVVATAHGFNPCGKYHYKIGWEGEIISQQNPNSIDIKFINGETIDGCSPSSFKHIEPQVGDTVKIVGLDNPKFTSTNQWKNQTGIVESINGEKGGTSQQPIGVRIKSVGLWYQEVGSIKVIKREEKSMEFKVGQKVIIVGGTSEKEDNNRKGQVGTIDNISAGSYQAIKVRFKDGYTWWYTKKGIEAVSMTKAELKTGQVVKCRNGNLYLVQKDFAREGDQMLNLLFDGSANLSSWKEDLTYSNKDYDILEVRETNVENLFSQIKANTMNTCFPNYNLVWKREDEDPKVKELEGLVSKLQGQLTDAQSELKRIKG